MSVNRNLLYVVATIFMVGCNQTSSNNVAVKNNDSKPTVKAASLRPIVETRNIDGFTVTRHSMDQKKRFAIGISPTTKGQSAQHAEIARKILRDVCRPFGPPLDRQNFALGQVAQIVGHEGYLSPAFDEANKTAYIYLWCNVITRKS